MIDREIGDRRGEGVDLGNLGLAYTDLGEAQRRSLYTNSTLRREIGDRHGEAIASWNLGLALEQQGELARGQRSLCRFVSTITSRKSAT